MYKYLIVFCLLLGCSPTKGAYDKPDADSPIVGNENISTSSSPQPNENNSLEQSNIGLDAGVIDSGPFRECGDYPDLAKCLLDKPCDKHSDCLSNVCDDRHLCIADKSCANYYGGRTCGEKEVGDPDAKHESCCISLPLPSGKSLDKYKITAGRMRTFLSAVNNNVRQWYLNNRNNLNADQKVLLDPYVNFLPQSDTPGDPYSVSDQLGNKIYVEDRPSNRQGCTYKGTGMKTYWFPASVNNFYGDIESGFSKDVLDTKPLNCVAAPLLAAFCAWDNKKLQTYEENSEAYGPDRFAWGNSPQVGGYANTPTGWGLVGPGDKFDAEKALPCPSCDPTISNWAFTYTYPPFNPNVMTDYSPYVSAPGRFPRDVGKYGQKDLGGNLIEITSSDGNWLDKGRTTNRWGKSGSFEGHMLNRTNYSFPVMTVYSRAGGRCSSL